MLNLVIKVRTNKVGSEVKRVIKIDEEDIHDNEIIDEIVNENVNEMIDVSYEIE